MKMLADILAVKRDFDITQIVFILAVVVIGIVSSLIKKAAENNKKRQADAERQASRPANSSQQNTDDEQLPSASRKTRADRLYEQAHQRRLKYEQQEQFGHAAAVQSVAIKSPPEHKTHVAGNMAAEKTRVEQELRQLRSRQQKLENQRDQRMTTASPGSEDTTAIEARLLHIPEAERPAIASGLKISLQLANLQQAKAAIVFHEIFSPPKALRHEAEMWDM